HIHGKKACNAKVQDQGLSNDQIKQYGLKYSSDFGGSKSETELACQLFPQKFKDVHLVYNKLNYSERQELYKTQRAYASWILDQENLSVISTKCKNFTSYESKICEECNKLRNNSCFRDAISA
ncbi:12570_t:CDS:2, partial [Dentiscutata heterogama]